MDDAMDQGEHILLSDLDDEMFICECGAEVAPAGWEAHCNETELAYECPDCGDGHDGMTTGTERCPDCQCEFENPRSEDEESE